MSKIIYHHDRNLHSLYGAIQGLKYFLENHEIHSLLDVGAGTGNWLYAAQQSGINDVMGVDGIAPEGRKVFVPPELINQVDLTKPLKLGRRFDAVLCLEVAEHLHKDMAPILIDSLCDHSNLVFFSAAAPGQGGECHVNCQSPEYWQSIFNKRGFVCYDDLRSRIWNDTKVEPWYRQNAFTAVYDPKSAGTEPHIPYLIHPEMTRITDFTDSPAAGRNINIEAGMCSPQYYLRLLAVSLRLRLKLIAKKILY